MLQLIPLGAGVSLPTALATTAAAVLRTPVALDLREISGSLQVIISGSYSVNIRDQAGRLIGTLSWSAAGQQLLTLPSPYRIPVAGYVQLDVASVGVGAANAYLMVWASRPVRPVSSVGLAAADTLYP